MSTELKESKMYQQQYNTMESSFNTGKTLKVLNPGMIRRTLKSLLFVFALMSWHSSDANFIVGGDITYRCIPMMGSTGLMKYEVTLTVYGDCNNGKMSMFDRQARIDFYHTNAAGITSFIHPLLPFVSSIDTLSSGINPSCDPEASEVCVVRAIYRDTVTLDQRLGNYTFAYQRCCRNATIDNIEDPMNTGMTVTATLTQEARNSCNAGPVFNQYPEIFVCLGQNISVDAGATEPDGDELRYRLCTPYQFGSMTQMWPNAPVLPPYEEIVWVPPYSETNMMGGSNPLTINPATGIISGTPDIAGQFLIGVCVDEFRNGEFISSTRRDFQLNTIACGDIPTADFNAPDLQCGNLTVTFENTSVNHNSSQWFFDWPSTDLASNNNDPQFTFTFPDTGSYQVALIVDNGTGCTDTLIKTVTLRNTGIIIDFTFNQFLCGDSLTTFFADISTDSISTLESNVWTIAYGDTVITIINVMDPTVSLPLGEVITVTLTVTAANGCTGSITKEYVANSDIGLIPDYTTLIEKCNDTYTIRVTDASLDSLGDILTWAYVLTPTNGPPQNSDEQNPTFVLDGFQNVTLSLTITSTTGCEGTITRTFPLNPDINLDPVFDFDVTECDSILVIHFTDNSFDDDPAITDRLWKVVVVGTTDTLTFNTPNFTVTYTTSVNLQVSLTNTYDNGCVSTTVKVYNFNLLGEMDWQEEYELCPGKRIQLNVNPTFPGLQYNWSPTDSLFGPTDESPWAGPAVTTTYSVTITDPVTGCSIVREATVTIKDEERAEFTFDVECGSTEVTFTKSTGGPVVRWEFGDPAMSTSPDDPTTSFTYPPVAGTYIATLYTGGECPDTISKEIRLTFIDIDCLLDSIPACDGDTVFLNPGCDPEIGYSYLWEPADLIIGPNNVPNPRAYVTETTKFIVRIFDLSVDTCGLSREVTVFVPDPITLNAESFLHLCKDTTVNLIAFSPTADSYTWVNQNGDTLGTGPELNIYLNTDVVITVIVIDIYGCRVEKSVAVEFFRVLFNSENPLCIGDTTEIFITVPGETPISYVWSPADRIISGGNTSSIMVSPSETTVYTVVVTYPDGCVLTGTYTQVVSDFIAGIGISAEPDTILTGNTSVISVSPAPGTYGYMWEPADKVRNPNSPMTETESLDETTTFTVKITNEDGCELLLSTTVTVTDPRCEEPFVFLPNLFTPNNDGVNDILYLRAFEPFITSVELLIYNRYGREVFKSTSLNSGWDGTFQGEALTPDTFGFYLKVICIDGQTFTKKGSVTLIR